MTDIMVPPKNSPLVKRWTREACLRMEQVGLLQHPYELVEGAVNLMGQNIRHASGVRLLLYWLFAMFGKDFVLTQTSIDVAPEDNPTSEPMPDAVLLTRPVDTLTDNPRPEEIRLLIEVSDSTLAYDLTTKAGLYARAGISEYWIVNLPERKLHIHRAPQSGVYNEETTVMETETAILLGDTGIAVRVSELLPPVR